MKFYLLLVWHDEQSASFGHAPMPMCGLLNPRTSLFSTWIKKTVTLMENIRTGQQCPWTTEDCSCFSREQQQATVNKTRKYHGAPSSATTVLVVVRFIYVLQYS
jgi:hypothetical protein